MCGEILALNTVLTEVRRRLAHDSAQTVRRSNGAARWGMTSWGVGKWEQKFRLGRVDQVRGQNVVCCWVPSGYPIGLRESIVSVDNACLELTGQLQKPDRRRLLPLGWLEAEHAPFREWRWREGPLRLVGPVSDRSERSAPTKRPAGDRRHRRRADIRIGSKRQAAQRRAGGRVQVQGC
jgi:hypothetical protein